MVEQLATAALERVRDRNDTLGLLVLDLDAFADVNEKHGHDRADKVLAAVGAELRQQTRP